MGGPWTGDHYSQGKLLQKLTAMREVILFKMFLDLQKAYDALDWYR